MSLVTRFAGALILAGASTLLVHWVYQWRAEVRLAEFSAAHPGFAQTQFAGGEEWSIVQFAGDQGERLVVRRGGVIQSVEDGVLAIPPEVGDQMELASNGGQWMHRRIVEIADGNVQFLTQSYEERLAASVPVWATAGTVFALSLVASAVFRRRTAQDVTAMAGKPR
jgi:hypothetical protein